MAFEKVKTDYEFDNGRLAIINQDRYDATYDIMGNHFTPDEPICRALGATWTKDFGLISDMLKQNVSICNVSEDTDEVIGVHVMSVMKRSDPKFDPSSVNDEPLRHAFMFLHKKRRGDEFS